MQNENISCLIVISFLPTHMNHMNGTDGIASQLLFPIFVHKLFLHLDRAIGINLRFFDPQVAFFCGDKPKSFLREGEAKILNFLITVVFLLLTVCLLLWDIGMGANPGGDGGCIPPIIRQRTPHYFAWKWKIPHTMCSKPRKMINFAKSLP